MKRGLPFLTSAARQVLKRPLRILLEVLYQRSSKPAHLRSLEKQLEGWQRMAESPVYCGNVDEWHEYFDHHHDRLEGKLEALCAGTDQRSREEAALFYYRYRYVFPPSRFQNHVFFDPDILLTKEEKAAALELEAFARKPLEFEFPEGVGNGEIHLFWSQLGLVHLPPAVLARIKGGDVIDGGAYCGDSAMVFTKYHPRSVHAFEAFPPNYSLLEQVITLNHKEDVVIPVPMGLGRERGSLNIVSHGHSGFATDVQLVAAGARTPPGRKVVGSALITSIDDYVAERKLRPVVIKLDVEGSEYDVIEGAMQTISKFRPILLISIYHRPRDFFEIRGLIEKAAPQYDFKFRYLCPGSPSNEFILLGLHPESF